MKKLLFIGHVYHQKTKSNVFVMDILQQEYDIYECYLDPAESLDYQELNLFYGKEFDALVVWQVMPKLSILKKYVTWKTSLFFPMYDHYYAHGGLFQPIWEEYQETIIVCFSRTLYNEITANGFDTRYIQFFPQPCKIENWGDESSIFFWQRLSILNLSTLAIAMKNYGLNRIHLHKAPDPGHQIKEFLDYNDYDTKRFFHGMKRTESSWFENKAQLVDEINRHAFFMAPRHVEGIGMSFLEAMASGRVVVAPDMPTMNEYIEDGKNGLLYPWDEYNKISHCQRPVKHAKLSIRTIQQNAYQTIVEGYERWCRQKLDIVKWADLLAKPDLRRLDRCAVSHGWKEWPIDEQQFPDREELLSKVQEKSPDFGVKTANPIVSVVTVVFNAVKDGRKDMLLQCMESVQNQEGVTIEHVIVDGGSTDGTIALVENYKNRNVPIRFLSMSDSGVYEAMNRGLAIANGDYVTYLNSDDFYHNPSGMADSVKVLQQTGCAYSFAPISVVDDFLYHNPHVIPYLYIFEVFQHAVFSHQSILMKKKLMLDLHGFDMSYRSAADYDLVLRMILAGYKGCYVDSNFVSYRMTGMSSVNPHLSGRETGLIFWRLYNKYLGAHLTREDAYLIHSAWRFPTHSRDLQERIRGIVSNAFVGLPEVVYRKPDHWKVAGYALRCLVKGQWRLLKDFLIVQGNSRFNQYWYGIKYCQDIDLSGLPPAAHYLIYGWREGKDPSPAFSTNNYLNRYPDVRKMDICPIVHWKLRGKREGRYCD